MNFESCTQYVRKKEKTRQFVKDTITIITFYFHILQLAVLGLTSLVVHLSQCVVAVVTTVVEVAVVVVVDNKDNLVVHTRTPATL